MHVGALRVSFLLLIKKENHFPRYSQVDVHVSCTTMRASSGSAGLILFHSHTAIISLVGLDKPSMSFR